MCQVTITRLSNHFESCQVQKVASLLTEALKETFISRLRDELLDREVFANLKEAKVLAEDYRDHYNHHRAHGALGYLTPCPIYGHRSSMGTESALCAHRATEGARIRTETLIMTGTENGEGSLLQDDAVQPNG